MEITQTVRKLGIKIATKATINKKNNVRAKYLL